MLWMSSLQQSSGSTGRAGLFGGSRLRRTGFSSPNSIWRCDGRANGMPKLRYHYHAAVAKRRRRPPYLQCLWSVLSIAWISSSCGHEKVNHQTPQTHSRQPVSHLGHPHPKGTAWPTTGPTKPVWSKCTLPSHGSYCSRFAATSTCIFIVTPKPRHGAPSNQISSSPSRISCSKRKIFPIR